MGSLYDASSRFAAAQQRGPQVVAEAREGRMFDAYGILSDVPYVAAAGQVSYGTACRDGETAAQCAARQQREAQGEATRRAFDIGAQVIGATGNTIAAIITAGNRESIARIEAETRQRQLEIQAQIASTQSEAELVRLREQLNGLTALQTAINTRTVPPERTALYVVAGIAGVLLLGGIVYLAVRPRRNPGKALDSHLHTMRNPVVQKRRPGRTNKRRFVSAAKLRRQRRRAR